MGPVSWQRGERAEADQPEETGRYFFIRYPSPTTDTMQKVGFLSHAEFHASVCVQNTTGRKASLWTAQQAYQSSNLGLVSWPASGLFDTLDEFGLIDTVSWFGKRRAL